MAVSDLTNTIWVLEDYPDIDVPSSGTFNINFISNSNNYTYIQFTGDLIYYNSTTVYMEYDSTPWLNNNDRIISITGGSDATNSTLISWLQNNAFQILITDLTDTTWVFNNRIGADFIDYDYWYINIEIAAHSSSPFDRMRWNPNGQLELGSDQYIVYSAYGSTSGWANTDYKTWTITGGTNVTNLNLIAWFTLSATLITYDPVTWKFKHYIANTVPGSGDYLQLDFNYYCELTAADMGTNDCCNFVSEGVLTPFSTWQELVVQLPDALEAFGATDVTSTLSASSVPADYKTKWSANACEFNGSSGDGYWFGTGSVVGINEWTITEYPDITGTISFTFDGNSYNLNFTQLLQAIIDVTGTPLFNVLVEKIYDRETGYTCEGMRTITITGGDDAEDVDLVTWLQTNAVEVIPFTEGVRVTYNGDVIKQLDIDGTFALSCANKLMASNITIETLNVGSIVVTYDNDTIIDSSGTHNYQLPCNKKMADTDIVVTLVMTVLPDNLLVTSEGNYIVDVSDGYLITAPPPSGYSGNILSYSITGSGVFTCIKFEMPPSDANDNDARAVNGNIWGATNFSDKTKIYAWGEVSVHGSPKVKINNVETVVSTNYAAPTEITLNGDYDIYLGYAYGSG